MDNKTEKKYEPILPFDYTYGEAFIIYNNVKYTQNLDLLDEDPIKMDSGNIIKYYRCEAKEAVKVGGY